MTVLQFPSRSVLAAVSALENMPGPEVDAWAATILVLALDRQEATPSWTMTLLLSTLLRNLDAPFALRLAARLSLHVHHVEVVAVGLMLVTRPAELDRSVGAILLGQVRARHWSAP